MPTIRMLTAAAAAAALMPGSALAQSTTSGSTTTNTQGTTTGFTGMGSPVVQAPAGSAIIFAELTYNYKPLVGSWALGNFQLRKEAAFFVRDSRDLTTQPDNPSPAANASLCSQHNTTF